MKTCYIDFEFRDSKERVLDLVCCSLLIRENGENTLSKNFWLRSDKEKLVLRDFIENLRRQGCVFISYVLEAEIRSLQSLYLDIGPECLIDLYLEYRCLLNRNDDLAYGKQLIKGAIITTKPPLPKYERLDEDKNDDLHHKPSYSLAAALYKMLGVVIDTSHKDQMRDLIIHGSSKDLENDKINIMQYCQNDVKYLPLLADKIQETFRKLGVNKNEWVGHAFKRGEYAYRTALMIEEGYPVDVKKLNKFTKAIPSILEKAAEDCLEHLDAFTWDTKQNKYKAVEANIRQWVEQSPYKKMWRKTSGKKLSLSRDAFKDWYDSESEGFAGAYCRYLKTKQSLNGFMPVVGSNKSKFDDYLGSDGRVRPFMGIYGSQSARSQPGATGFIPLKAAWMKNFIQPKSGYCLASADFVSQEFLISALMSQDFEMMNAYKSGDVYLSFAKSIGLVPLTATKESHKRERDIAKTLVLGISYDMTAKGLAPRLSEKSGSDVSENKAQDYIDAFFETYSDFADWKVEIVKDYEDDGFLKLQDGWHMWGDNDNLRSVGNFPVQGTGSVILREAVATCQESGLKVLYTVHDSICVEFPNTKMESVGLLHDCMVEAFRTVMKPYGHVLDIGIDGHVWGDLPMKMPVEKSFDYSKEYVDKKGEKDLKRYRDFFS
jgi:DNA polymerase-1